VLGQKSVLLNEILQNLCRESWLTTGNTNKNVQQK